MSQTRIPFVPFDPTEVGPLDVLSAARYRTRSFVNEHAKVLIPSGVVLVALLVWAHVEHGLSWPGLPNWLKAGLLGSGVMLPWAYIVGSKLAKGLHRDDSVILSVTDATNGDQDLLRISPDTFDRMTVLNHNDKERGREFLHIVRINGVAAYEVDRYDADKNVAVASWQAGASNREIRRDRRVIKRIKTTLEREADKALEALVNHPEILRKQTSAVANRIIAVAEEVEQPGASGLHDELSDLLDEADPSQALLDDDEDVDDDGLVKLKDDDGGSDMVDVAVTDGGGSGE